MYKKPLISLIGAGQIGSSLAHRILTDGIGDVVLFDINTGIAEGKAKDLKQAATINGKDCNITGTSNYEHIHDSDVIIVTAGLARKPGMTREDLLQRNMEIITHVAQNVAIHSPKSFVIVVTNPLDVMVQLFQKISAMPTNMVVGMTGILDSARFRCLLAEEFKVSSRDVNAFVLGGHGDTMVPILDYSTINGISLPEMLKMGKSSQENLDDIVEKTRVGGGEIVKLLVSGSAYYAPAAAAMEMAESFLLDRKRMLSCAAYLNGEYGINGLYIGVPVIIGKNGVEAIVELKLNKKDQTSFNLSVEAVRKLIEPLNLIK